MLKKRELIIDSFAGGGGASLGIKMATGRCPDIAINHDEHAIEMHAINHPDTLHLHEDVWLVDLHKIVRGRPVGLLWCSPDCTDFSRAKGDVPVRNKIRGLARVITKWAHEIKPRVIILENVREFQEWGPLAPKWVCRSCNWKGVEGQAILARKHRHCPRCNSVRLTRVEGKFPDPEKRGLSFKRWVGRLRSAGYVVEWRVINAADYGSPTNRRRLFLIARRDGEPIVWPEPTHAPPNKLTGSLKPYLTVAECIDWDLPCPSIFERDPPLVEQTMRRIAYGFKRYVLEAEKPFIVRCNHGGNHFRGQPVDIPFCTITKSHDAHGLVVPDIAPLVIDIERSQSDFRGRSVDQPSATITAQPKGGKHALVAAYLAQHNGDAIGRSLERPAPTATQRSTQQQLVTAFLSRYFGNSIGQPLESPSPTQTQSNHSYLVAGSLIQTGYGEREGQQPRALDLSQPSGTIVAGGIKQAVVAANLVHMNHGDKQWSSVEEPLRTITSNTHARLVYSYLLKYYGTAIGQSVQQPLDTITKQDRFGLVLIWVQSVPYVVIDIGMRMLHPSELAAAQGFPKDYVFTGSKVKQVARIGNSVCPQPAAALVRANLMQKTPRRRRAATAR